MINFKAVITYCPERIDATIDEVEVAVKMLRPFTSEESFQPSMLNKLYLAIEDEAYCSAESEASSWELEVEDVDINEPLCTDEVLEEALDQARKILNKERNKNQLTLGIE